MGWNFKVYHQDPNYLGFNYAVSFYSLNASFDNISFLKELFFIIEKAINSKFEFNFFLLKIFLPVLLFS
jgi:hypothetical protein